VNFPTRRVYRPRPPAGGSKHAPAGRLRADGSKTVRDDNGRFFPLSASFFMWWWAWKNDRDRGLQNFAEIAPWTDEVRVFGEVGGKSWEDRVVDPRDPAYEDIGKAATDYAFGEKLTRTQLTVYAGGTGADPDMTYKKVANILRGRLEAFSSVEWSNEGNGIDRATMRRLCQQLQAEFPGLMVATTSGGGDDFSTEGFDLDIANLGTNHSERGAGDEDWHMSRQGCETMGLPKQKDNNEPPGFESSVRVLHEPCRLASLRLVGIIAGGMVKYCHHTGAGVRFGGAADLARGRASNFWEYDGSSENRPSMAQAVAAYRAAESMVPDDAPNWRGVKGHWPDTRLFADVIWSDDAGRHDHGCVRVYGSYQGSGYAEMVIGVRRFVNLTQKAGGYNVRAVDVVSGEVVLDRPVADGETFRLEGDPNVWGSAPTQAGSSRSYLIVGSR
jgi:hypothetical protein